MNAIIETPAVAQKVRAGVNQQALFASLRHLFKDSFSVLGELMQNARRAGASRVEFDLDPEANTLTITDNGCGIEDFNVLIMLCKSAWDEQVTLTDRPFGMGLFALFFAGRSVTFRSRGLALQVCMDDIVARRTLHALPDPAAPTGRGTVFEVQGLDKVFTQHAHYKRNLPTLDELGQTALAQQLAVRATGFPIPVLLNGHDLPRPHAQEHLRGDLTPIGFVSLPGVHNFEPILSEFGGLRGMALYLQGLPIGDRHESGSQVVHLDSTQFTARMPDRSHLYDESEQTRKVQEAVAARIQGHLAQRKSAMNGSDFVRTYWHTCITYQCQSLLLDIPWVPATRLHHVAAVSADSEDVWSCDRHALELIRREEVASGRIRVWCDEPLSTEEDAWAPLVLKVMQKAQVFSMAGSVPHGHWLHELATSVLDLQFDVEPVNPGGEVSYVPNENWEHCTVQVVDAVKVRVTCDSQAAFEPMELVFKDWLVVPEAPEGQEIDPNLPQGPTRCYVSGTGRMPSEVVDVFSEFADDDLEAQKRDDVVQRWTSLVLALRGCTLATGVAHALQSQTPSVSESQLRQLCVVRARRCQGEDGTVMEPRLEVVDLEEERVWAQVAQALEADDSAAPLALRLKATFAAALKPGEAQPAETAAYA